MTTNLDALLTELNVTIDDQVREPRRRRPGRPKRLTDAELVCGAVAQRCCGVRAANIIGCAGVSVGSGTCFPYLPKQPGYHKRVKPAAPLICKAMLYLATQRPSWADQVHLVDATPVPCGASRETAQRSELAGWANDGYCAAHSHRFGGLKL